MKYGKKIMTGGLWLFLFTLVATALGYATRLFLARTLPTAEFGLFYSVSAFVGFFWAFKDFGYSAAVVKYIPEWLVKEKHENINSMVWFGIITQFIIGLAISVSLFICADFLAVNFFRDTGASIVIRVLALEVLIAVVFLRQIVLGFQKIFHYSSFDVIRNILIVIFVIPFVGMGALGVALSFLFASLIIQAIFLYYVFTRLLSFRPVLTLRNPEKAALTFGGISFVSSVFGYIMSYADTVFLTGLRGLYDVGLYQAALPTSQLLWVFATAMAIVMMPVFSEMWAKDQNESLKNGITLSVKLMIMLMMVPFLIIATWPDVVLSVLFGKNFVEAASALRVLAFGAVFYSLMLINLASLSAIGRPGKTTVVYIIAGISNIAINVLLIPHLGIIGAALAAVVSYTIGFCVVSFYSLRYIGSRMPWFAISKAIIAGFTSLLLAYLTRTFLVMPVYVEIMATLAVALLVYILLLKIFRAVNAKDIGDLESMGISIPGIVKKILL